MKMQRGEGCGEVEEAAIAAGVTKVRRIRQHFIKKP